MIHIVFQQDDVALLKDAMQLDETLQGEIFEIKDEWGVGPLQNLDEESGWTARMEWWRQLLQGSPYENMLGSFDDRITVSRIKEKLSAEPDGEAWIWMGQNQHDVTGYYWLMRQLKEYQGRVMIIYLNNLPFINEKGQLFYPWAIGNVLPKEIIKAKKLARPITLSEYEIDPDEWKKITEENAMVRVLEGGKKIAGKEENFYDIEILKNLTGEWQKANRVITNTLNRMKIKTGDVFLMWRLKQLIADGKVETTGDMQKSWKDFDVRKQERKQGELKYEEQVEGAS
ncbi:MAG TPA: DUF1835 domain-containing protein [Chitinophagaceae bacterium]|jgi:hypothetical protein|nr:MAG: hypothetical protein BWZ05_00687 [Bacteroidetes bacterium ADurb.BinA245]HNA19284.1 DUF1835 domain-containing protein [Chitinophagaceae bacterium]HNA91531.1 DUF1835 domain-containing protein [Chitinophagaceae bacterium]HNF46372.1 DUF1835 domain-containing protein [Chitinophagaceae bacterium]HNN99578.1 DUF1835 domain-containing protein [Chitinophagaceae bacterium]